MSSAPTDVRSFTPGTTGWTVHDLDDPRVQREWVRGRYEIVDGVLTTMPAAYFSGGNALFNLMFTIKEHLQQRGLPGRFAPEVEIVIDELRVARADAVLLLPTDEEAQRRAADAAGRRDPQRTLILVPPTLVIESISPGHELHDRLTKSKWYAEFGIANYWLIDAFEKSLVCMVLEGKTYREDARGDDDDEVRPNAFAGLTISLAGIWGA